MTIPFSVPFVASQGDSWGPPGYDQVDDANPNAPPSSGKYVDLPYAPFGRNDRLGRAADFTNASRGDRSRFNRQDRRYGRDGYNNRNRRDNEDKDEDDDDNDEAFQLVDTSKATTTKRFVPPAAKRRQHTARLRQVNARRQQGGPETALSQQVLGRG
ncbi:MAG: hypothetical protein SGARI_003611, partial [Bacillariaceae sp.]